MSRPSNSEPNFDPPNFDRIAKPYRTLEYLTLGSTLQRCRTYFLPALLQQRSALVLGDGDGRFLRQLLDANPHLRVDAVDTSRAMLDLLRTRCADHLSRLHTHATTAQAFAAALPPAQPYDLVVTHFFLDCLTQTELEALVQTLRPQLAPEAVWLLSDFRIPPRGLLRPFGWLLVRGLYFAFRLITGLRTQQLPDHAAALTKAGLRCVDRKQFLRGLLTTELWHAPTSSSHSPSTN